MSQHLTYEQLDKLFDFLVRLYLDQLTKVVDENFVTAMHVTRYCPPNISSDETKPNECMHKDDSNVCTMHVCHESRLNACSVGKDTTNITLPKSDKSSSSPNVSNSFIDETKQDNTFTFVSISAQTIEKSYIKIKRNRGRPRKVDRIKHH